MLKKFINNENSHCYQPILSLNEILLIAAMYCYDTDIYGNKFHSAITSRAYTSASERISLKSEIVNILLLGDTILPISCLFKDLCNKVGHERSRYSAIEYDDSPVYWLIFRWRAWNVIPIIKWCSIARIAAPPSIPSLREILFRYNGCNAIIWHNGERERDGENFQQNRSMHKLCMIKISRTLSIRSFLCCAPPSLPESTTNKQTNKQTWANTHTHVQREREREREACDGFSAIALSATRPCVRERRFLSSGVCY